MKTLSDLAVSNHLRDYASLHLIFFAQLSYHWACRTFLGLFNCMSFLAIGYRATHLVPTVPLYLMDTALHNDPSY